MRITTHMADYGVPGRRLPYPSISVFIGRDKRSRERPYGINL